MKISTEIYSASLIVGEEKAVELCAKAGFDAWDFSMFTMCNYDWTNKVILPNNHPLAGKDYLKFVRRLKQISTDNGIHCNQTHAPFPVSCKEIRVFLKRAIECTAEIGGEICVIHPNNDKTAEENAIMYSELLPFAKQCGVKIATENMWNWDESLNQSTFAAGSTPESFCAHVDEISDEYMVACLDIGHAEMKGSNTSAVEMIHALGRRLQALHIHDNDKWQDLHQIPFSMDVDFCAIVNALKDIGYSGYLTLEANGYLNDRTKETVLDGLKDLALSAKRLAEMMK